MSCFMGIDAGTSGIKAVVISAAGEILGVGYHECDLITPRPGWVDQNPLDWWEACSAAATQAAAKSGRGMGLPPKRWRRTQRPRGKRWPRAEITPLRKLKKPHSETVIM